MLRLIRALLANLDSPRTNGSKPAERATRIPNDRRSTGVPPHSEEGVARLEMELGLEIARADNPLILLGYDVLTQPAKGVCDTLHGATDTTAP